MSGIVQEIRFPAHPESKRLAHLSPARNHLAFGALLLASAVLALPAVLSLFRLSIGNDAYSYILMVLPASAALAGLEWKTVARSERFSRNGIALLCGIALLAGLHQFHLLDLPSDLQLSVSIALLVSFWIVAFVACFSLAAARNLAFPLLFLYLLVPLPQAWLAQAVLFLQHGSTIGTYWLFRLFGVPVLQSGSFVLSLPDVTIEVAEECSSIRSSAILLVTSAVLAHLFLRSNWRKGIVILAAIPLSVAKNAVRIFVLSILATHVDLAFLTGRFHREGGLLAFVLALVGICLLVAWLRKTERVDPRDSMPPGQRRVEVQTKAIWKSETASTE